MRVLTIALATFIAAGAGAATLAPATGRVDDIRRPLLIEPRGVMSADGRATRPREYLLPRDPFRAVAVQALNGEFGPLEEWQRVGYRRALEVGFRRTTGWLTTYYPEEGFYRGKGTRYGYGVDERCAAANRLPARTFVWHPKTGIRQVLDTGASSNDSVAHRRGAELWIDFWEPSAGALGIGADTEEVIIIPRR
jgi:hypothetical protein